MLIRLAQLPAPLGQIAHYSDQATTIPSSPKSRDYITDLVVKWIGTVRAPYEGNNRQAPLCASLKVGLDPGALH